jgi:hypothetical protein
MYREDNTYRHNTACCRPGTMHAPRWCGIGFGIMLILVGVFLLGSRLGWFDTDLFWPVAIIVMGAMVLATGLKRTLSRKEKGA